MKILESDLYLISRIGFKEPGETYVLDPGKDCIRNFESGFKFVKTKIEVDQLTKIKRPFYLINISGAKTLTFPFNFDLVKGVISFNRSPETHERFYYHEVYYSKDDQDRIRWIISENHKLTDFQLDLSENKSWVDVGNFFSVFPELFKLIQLKLNNQEKVTDGKIQILTQDRKLFCKTESLNYTSFSINLANSFKTQIISARFYSKKNLVFFAKRSIGTKGKKSLENENSCLEKLAHLKFQSAQIPASELEKNDYIIRFQSNFNKAEYYKLQLKANEIFLKSTFEYIFKTLDTLKVSLILKEERIPETLFYIKNKIEKNTFPKGLSTVQFVKVFTQMVLWLEEINVEKIIPVSLVNMDLIPENIGISQSGLTFLNWENSRFNYPVLFDLFNYYFTYIESMETTETELLINNIEQLSQREEVKELTNKYQLDFNLHLRVFMLLRFAPEMSVLLAKQIVPPEISLKLFVWADFADKFFNKGN